MTDIDLETHTRNIPAFDDEQDSTPVVALTVLFHPDYRRIGDRALLKSLQSSGRQVGISRLEPRFAPPYGTVVRPLASPFLSRRPVVVASESSGAVAISVRDTSTTVDADGERLSGVTYFDSGRVDRGIVLDLSAQVVLLLHRIRPERAEPRPDYGLIGASDALDEVRDQIAFVARSTAPVLIRGETGAGKELVARAIHAAGKRSSGPFVAVNMAAVPPSLAASELFGHAAGAFSGATTKHRGYFSRASGGTLFLDEIGDTPLEVQPMLLRALEIGEVQSLGSTKMEKVNARLVSATDARIEDAIESGTFRAPLLYRLANHEIRVPPLRERRADIGRLLRHFLLEEMRALECAARLDQTGGGGRLWLPTQVVARLVAYRWPGNVRQLRNVARHIATVASAGAAVTVRDPALARLLNERTRLPEVIQTAPAPVAAPSPPPKASKRRAPHEISSEELEQVLESLDWRLGPAAKALGVSRPTLNDMVDRHPTLTRARHLGVPQIMEALDSCDGDFERVWRLLRVSRRSLRLRMGELGLK